MSNWDSLTGTRLTWINLHSKCFDVSFDKNIQQMKNTHVSKLHSAVTINSHFYQNNLNYLNALDVIVHEQSTTAGLHASLSFSYS